MCAFFLGFGDIYSVQLSVTPTVERTCVTDTTKKGGCFDGRHLINSRQNGGGAPAPFWVPVVRGGRARGGPWLSGLWPDAVSRMRLCALGGGGGIARAGWRGVIPAEDSHRRRGGVLPTGVERRLSGLSSASSAGT